MNNFFSEEKNDFKEIWNRIRKKDFSGNSGQAIKNSVYQLLTNFTTKIGAFIFTVIMARILVPDLFGAYSLALSTILIFVAFSDLGIGQTIIRFVSKELSENNYQKAESYLRYLSKMKIFLAFSLAIILLILSRFISAIYSDKPIYLALLVGSLYIIFTSFVALMQSILQANNHFKPIFLRETIFQLIRIIVIPLLVLLLIKNSGSQEMVIFVVILSLAITYLLSGTFLFFYKKKYFSKSLTINKNLPLADKKKVKKFIFFSSATVLSGVFFGYIDIIMLGKFVSSEYIAFYNVAFNFIGAIIPLITFSTALLPTFTKLNPERLDVFFKKTIKISLIFSILGFLFLLFFAPFLINIIFGEEYSVSSNILRLFSLLLISSSVSEIYSIYFTSLGKPHYITYSLIISTLLNIILNYILISSLIIYGPIYAVYGATFATIISRWFYTISLIFSKRKIVR